MTPSSHPNALPELISNDFEARPAREATAAAADAGAHLAQAAGDESVLLLRHPSTGQCVQLPLPLGWSVPVLLLGPVELFRRRDWLRMGVSLALPLVGQILLAPGANRAYLKLLLRRGFRAVSTAPGQISRLEWQLGLQLPRYTGRSSKSAG